MRLEYFKGKKVYLIKLLLSLLLIISFKGIESSALILDKNEEIKSFIIQIFDNRNMALLNGDSELLESIYDLDTKYGLWAYEHEMRKMKYIQNWGERQGVKFIDINPHIIFKGIRVKGDKISVSLVCSTEYRYVYKDQTELINSSRIGTYHYLQLSCKDNVWTIYKEWYKDPFADSLNLDLIKADTIKNYILSKSSRDLSKIDTRRLAAVDYMDKYCGAASEAQYGLKYNSKYRDYNSMGGDCANFASQALHEGGKFRKNSTWNYDKGGATRAWVNADGFKRYFVRSGRASIIAYGSYEKVYKASYNLLPGDFVAYEKDGDINHISVVSGADSRGYALVTCHNTDRNMVPWDLGWSDKKIRFWLIRVHY